MNMYSVKSFLFSSYNESDFSLCLKRWVSVYSADYLITLVIELINSSRLGNP